MKKWLGFFFLIGSLLLVLTAQAATTPVKTTPVKAVVAKKTPAKPAVKGAKTVEPHTKVGLTKTAYNKVVASVTDFVNENLMAEGQKVAKIVITKKSGFLYFIDITLPDSRTVKSAFFQDNSKGGVDYFFPTAMNIPETKAETKKEKEAAAKNKSSETATTQASLVKTDKPAVEVFVMSYCPYGTQIEKGLLPVVKTLGDKADIQIKFVSYTMHGEKEFTENLLQYCINKEQPTKFWPYLECFLKEGTSADCLQTVGVDQAKTTACVTATTNEYKLVASGTDFPIYKEANLKYGVQGSPTLIVNGVEANSGRSAAALLKTVCGAFNTPPAECSTVLDSANPAPGFGTGASANPSAASCGS